MPAVNASARSIVANTYADVLPGKFASPAATGMLLAIGQQESRFKHRQQIGGPIARCCP
jgi:hypothetical protein